MLRSNYLAYLRGGSFASLANLKRLDLSRNKLTILSNNAFIGLESLELLNCSSNQFVHAPSASLHPLTSLRKLDLSDNLIAQLAPGTFFHLPIEELRLNQNEQLVAIDRGAFWDLPYLRQLSLKNNPMLQSINSQAFVGTQNLQSIDVDDCQALDSSGRQVLDNITMTATSRQLRYEQAHSSANIGQSAQLVQGYPASPISANTSSIKKSLSSKSSTNIANTTTTNNNIDSQPIQTPLQQPNKHWLNGLPINQLANMQQGNRLKYVYYLVSVTFLAIALKLVFKYTSTSHYLAARRRRRRVYETKADVEFDADDGRSITSNSAAFAMCVQPSGLVRSVGVSSGSESGSYSISEPDGQSMHSSEDLSDKQAAANDTSVISEANSGPCCPGCPLRVGTTETGEEIAKVDCCESSQQGSNANTDEQHQAAPQSSPLDLIHSQLIAAGFDYGHANCAHFYQSLGPALQLADMTANFVNQMDYY